MRTIVVYLFMIQLGYIKSILQPIDTMYADDIDLESIYKQALFSMDSNSLTTDNQQVQKDQPEIFVNTDISYPIGQLDNNLQNNDGLVELLKNIVTETNDLFESSENNLNLKINMKNSDFYQSQQRQDTLASEYPYKIYEHDGYPQNPHFYELSNINNKINTDYLPEVEVLEGEIEPIDLEISADVNDILKFTNNNFYRTYSKPNKEGNKNTSNTSIKISFHSN